MLKRALNKIKRAALHSSKASEQRFLRGERERLQERIKKGGSIKIHYGCGPRILKGWINIDLAIDFSLATEEYCLKVIGEKFYPKEIRGNRDDFYAIDIVKDGLPLPDNSVSVVFHEDFIEHLNEKEQIVFLSEIFRVLKPGGVHRVNTTDLGASMKKNSDLKKGKPGVYEAEWDDHGHKNILTPAILEELAQMVGYREIVFGGLDKSLSKDLPLESRPSGDRSNDGNIFADLIK